MVTSAFDTVSMSSTRISHTPDKGATTAQVLISLRTINPNAIHATISACGTNSVTSTTRTVIVPFSTPNNILMPVVVTCMPFLPRHVSTTLLDRMVVRRTLDGPYLWSLLTKLFSVMTTSFSADLVMTFETTATFVVVTASTFQVVTKNPTLNPATSKGEPMSVSTAFLVSDVFPLDISNKIAVRAKYGQTAGHLLKHRLSSEKTRRVGEVFLYFTFSIRYVTPRRTTTAQRGC